VWGSSKEYEKFFKGKTTCHQYEDDTRKRFQGDFDDQWPVHFLGIESGLNPALKYGDVHVVLLLRARLVAVGLRVALRHLASIAPFGWSDLTRHHEPLGPRVKGRIGLESELDITGDNLTN
jgi:hypothetical protein